MAAKASLRCFFGIVFSGLLHVEERSIVHSLFDFGIRVAQDHFRKFSKAFQFPVADVGSILFPNP